MLGLIKGSASVDNSIRKHSFLLSGVSTLTKFEYLRFKSKNWSIMNTANICLKNYYFRNSCL